MLKRTFMITAVLLLAVFSSRSLGQGGAISIDIKLLESILQKAGTHVMLKQMNGQIYALDEKRNTIYPAGYLAPKDEVFYVFDVNELRNILRANKLEKQKITTERSGTIMLQTDGGPGCPPDCP